MIPQVKETRLLGEMVDSKARARSKENELRESCKRSAQTQNNEDLVDRANPKNSLAKYEILCVMK